MRQPDFNISLLHTKLWGDAKVNTNTSLPLALTTYFGGLITYYTWQDLPISIALTPGTSTIKVVAAISGSDADSYFLLIGR